MCYSVIMLRSLSKNVYMGLQDLLSYMGHQVVIYFKGASSFEIGCLLSNNQLIYLFINEHLAPWTRIPAFCKVLSVNF